MWFDVIEAFDEYEVGGVIFSSNKNDGVFEYCVKSSFELKPLPMDKVKEAVFTLEEFMKSTVLMRKQGPYKVEDLCNQLGLESDNLNYKECEITWEDEFSTSFINKDHDTGIIFTGIRPLAIFSTNRGGDVQFMFLSEGCKLDMKLFFAKCIIEKPSSNWDVYQEGENLIDFIA